jgi:iron(III) transport system ATP-binding protein
MAGIHIKNLSKSYAQGSEIPAVKGLNISVPDGTFLTLLGPSGCGKTTTLRLIAGYIVPDTGSITVGDREVSSPAGVTPPESRGMGMVFQNYAVWPHKTVFENVAFGLNLRKLDKDTVRAKVHKALEQVNLLGFESRFPNELSGGQQQRVALARSLVVEPDILLLDEPLSNLDAKLREKMREELKSLQRRTGITFIYVTHDQAEALALSDQIVVMHLGEVQQIGSPVAVYQQPANRCVADFMGLVNVIQVLAESRQSGMSVKFSENTVWAGLPINSKLTAGQLDMVIRPENLQINKAASGPYALCGRIKERTFLGNVSEYWVQTDVGPLLRVQTHPFKTYEIGEVVFLEFDMNSTSFFPTETKT